MKHNFKTGDILYSNRKLGNTNKKNYYQVIKSSNAMVTVRPIEWLGANEDQAMADEYKPQNITFSGEPFQRRVHMQGNKYYITIDSFGYETAEKWNGR